MKMTYKDVAAAAMSLGKRDRRKLRGLMAESLDPIPVVEDNDDDFDDEGLVFSTDGMSDEEFKAELDRRAEEAERDPSVMIPWSVVKQEILEDLKLATKLAPARKRGRQKRQPISR